MHRVCNSIPFVTQGIFYSFKDTWYEQIDAWVDIYFCLDLVVIITIMKYLKDKGLAIFL